MYAEERQAAMTRLVTDRARISVTELADEFAITTETVRRDLSHLERQGLLRRVHGGAVPADPLRAIEIGLSERSQTNIDSKRRIGVAACAFLPPARSTVFIDAGSTTTALVEAIPITHPLVVLTHSVQLAGRLAQLPRVELHLLPGRVRPETGAAVGTETVAAISGLRADVAYLGSNGVTADFGCSTPDREEAATKRALVTHSRQVVVLADGSKIGEDSAARFASCEEIDVLVTDTDADQAELTLIADAGVEVCSA